jgi:hypothetical protein
MNLTDFRLSDFHCALTAVAMAACGAVAQSCPLAGVGPNPQLPAPEK